MPDSKKSKKLWLIGEIHNIVYKSAGEKELFEHDFKSKRPLLVSDGKNLFIKRMNSKMHFNPDRGLIN